MYESVRQMRAAVTAAVDDDLCEASDAALEARALALHRELTRVHAELTRTLGELAARDEEGEDTACWLARRTRMSRWQARQHVLTARRLTVLPATAAAFAAGRVGFDQVRLLAGVATDERAAAVARDEADLLGAAQRMTPSGLRGHLVDWCHRIDPEAVDTAACDAYEQRQVRVGQADDRGRVFADVQLDVEGGEILRTALDTAADAAFKPDDDRTIEQRRADALVDLAAFYLAHGQDVPDCGGERPHVGVRVDLEALEGRAGAAAAILLASGEPISGATARRLACDAQISRIITAGPSLVLDVGRATQTIPTGTRKAVIARDGRCVADGCTTRPALCEIHHIIPWTPTPGQAAGGPTNPYNLALLCRHHHRRVHHDGWQITRTPDGRPILRSPPGLRA